MSLSQNKKTLRGEGEVFFRIVLSTMLILKDQLNYY